MRAQANSDYGETTLHVSNYDNLAESIPSMGEIAAYHRRQKKAGSARKARYWERSQRASILRVAQRMAFLNQPYIVD